jgi:hypothetical protein
LGKLYPEGREILLTKDLQTLAEIAKLDGGYVLKTDLSEQTASKEVVHDRYKDLPLVNGPFARVSLLGNVAYLCA